MNRYHSKEVLGSPSLSQKTALRADEKRLDMNDNLTIAAVKALFQKKDYS